MNKSLKRYIRMPFDLKVFIEIPISIIIHYQKLIVKAKMFYFDII